MTKTKKKPDEQLGMFAPPAPPAPPPSPPPLPAERYSSSFAPSVEEEKEEESKPRPKRGAVSRSPLEEVVIAFAMRRAGTQFYMPELEGYVRGEIQGTEHGAARRTLDALKESGVLEYELTSFAHGLYRIVKVKP